MTEDIRTPVPQGSASLPEGLEKLADRLALIASADEGEAEAAARAAQHLARRIGLSGGQIKAIFLAGVRAIAAPASNVVLFDPAESAAAAERAGRLERETADLRRLVDRMDEDVRDLDHRAARLQEENADLRESLARAGARARRGRWMAALVAVALLAAAGVLYGVVGLRVVYAPGSQLGVVRMAAAGSSGAAIYDQPDSGAELLARLPAGAPLPVRQILWRGLNQWIETETGGRIGYVQATEVDLR